jgi:hypothetical protein
VRSTRVSRAVPGYMGDNCDQVVDHCATSSSASSSQPLCHNGGTCLNTVSGFTCRCARGWAGPRCREPYDECQRQPCSNGGRCETLPAAGSGAGAGSGGGEDRGYKCHCLEGTIGKLCHILGVLTCVPVSVAKWLCRY